MKEIDFYFHTMKTLCPLIEDEHLVQLRHQLVVRDYKKNAEVFSLNQFHDSIIFVNKGLVRTYYLNEKGEEKNAWFVQENEFITDYPCFLSGNKSSYVFKCMEPTIGVELPKKAVYEAYAQFSSIEKYGRLIAEEVVKMMQSRIEDLLFLTAKQRYKKVLDHDKGLVNRISLSQLASYLGIERQSLTRIRKEIQQEK